MKWITKDQESITKVIHSNPQYLPGVSFVYDIIAAFELSCKPPTFRILLRKSPAFTIAFIILRYDISFHIHTQHIFTHNI